MYEKDGKIEKDILTVYAMHMKESRYMQDFQLGKDLNQVRIAIRKHEYEG